MADELTLAEPASTATAREPRAAVTWDRAETIDELERILAVVKNHLKVALEDLGTANREVQRLRKELQSREDLLAVVSHDLRNPLSAIGLCTHLLARSAPEGERRADPAQLRVIERSVARMTRLIDDLLEGSTIEAGAFTVVPGREEAGALVEEVLAAMEPMAALNSIRLRAELAPGLPPFAGDRLRVMQVLSNLIGNALRFAPPQRGAIDVGVSVQGGELCFSVADNGPGISAELLPHVFDRYWKGKAEAHRGIGLGLFIAKGIVEAHGGRIWVESKLGAGSRFCFTVAVSSTPAEATPPQPAPQPFPGQASLRGLQALIVDDEAPTVSALTALLDDEGLRTLAATSGEQALASVEGHQPDVVVLDLEMPGMGGLPLLRRLRQSFPALPAVITSGHSASHPSVREALELTSVAFLPKPIDVDELLAAMGRLVGGCQSTSGTAYALESDPLPTGGTVTKEATEPMAPTNQEETP